MNNKPSQLLTSDDRQIICKAFIAFVFAVLFINANVYALPARLDILFVLDNSGSMKKNDPELMTHQSVLKLTKTLIQDSRVGVVVFDVKADFAMPLTSVANPDFEKDVKNSLRRLNYNGKYTNIPKALERAVYDLKQHGRKDADKVIIFMTDGFIDSGNAKKDVELAKWLKEDLTAEAKNAGIKIFSLAFTEEADFELIQTLAVKTGGGYFRAGKMEDLEKVFDAIQQAILLPQKTQPIVEKDGLPMEWVGGTFAIAVILGIVVISLRSKGNKKEIHQTPSVNSNMQPKLPEAILRDIESITGKKEIVLSKSEITIGRAVDGVKPSVDVAIPQNTVSALHALIEYRDKTFFITDRRSTNKTYLNNQPIASDVARKLKSGDFVTFDKYKFQFIVKEQISSGGTVFQPGTAGGTIIRPLGTSSDLKPEPVVTGHGQEDEEGTHVKPGVCEIHHSYKATEICPVCKKGFCTECMVEKNGQKMCRQCADDLP
ncbi:MAG: VWA domain-containing protein [Chlorobiaceae bacterium]|nr:VWA domain-containing protein [Chlorobiaceae bacterium]